MATCSSKELMREFEEFLQTPAGIYMAELFARRDSLADDDPEKEAVAADVLRHTFRCMQDDEAGEKGQNEQ